MTGANAAPGNKDSSPKPSATERNVRLARELPERPNENGGNIVFNRADVNRHASGAFHENIASPLGDHIAGFLRSCRIK